MGEWHRNALALILLWFGLCSSAFAHSPYFGQTEKIDHADFGTVEFAVLYGDGIFFADPSQVVVFDNDGYLLAATPQSEALLIRCDQSGSAPICRVYDEVRGLVFEPDHEQWARGRIIEEEGRPPRDAYPEYIDIEYGFTQRSATFMEKISFDAAGILNAPIVTLLSILWWCVAWSFVARLLWRWKRNGWQTSPLRGWAVVLGVLSVLALLGMSLLAAYAWLLEPYSVYFSWFVFSIGGLLAAILTRPKVAN